MEDIVVIYPELEIKDYDLLANICKNIKSQINKCNTSRISLCFYLNQIREFWKEYSSFRKNDSSPVNLVGLNLSYSKSSWCFGCYSAVEFVKNVFNISKSTYFRCLAVYDRFFYNGVFNEKFKDFDFIKLVELSNLSLEILEKDLGINLKPIMTKKEIISYVNSKSSTGETDKNETNKNELEELLKDEEEFEITDCSQLIRFKAENFEYMKDIVKEQKKFKDTSECINYLLEYAREHNLF